MTGVKTDCRDAEKLVRLYRAGELTCVQPPTPETEGRASCCAAANAVARELAGFFWAVMTDQPIRQEAALNHRPAGAGRPAPSPEDPRLFYAIQTRRP